MKETLNHKPKRRVVSWAIQVEWDNGRTENITDIPNDVSQTIDDWLTEVETEMNGLEQERKDNERTK